MRSAESTENAPVHMPAGDYVSLAQGFYFIFWGLLVTLLSGAQLVILIGLPPFSEWILAAGVLSTLVGSHRLYLVRSGGELWRHRVRLQFALAVLTTYFSVFFYLWRRVPENVYLLGNALAFAGSGIVYLVAFNRAVEALALALGRRSMARESQLLSAGNVVLLLLPFVGVIAYAISLAVARNSHPVVVLQSVLSHVHLLIVIVALLPFSLTLSLAWACKDVVLRELAALDRPRELGSKTHD